jgi:hypothetical protein
MLSFAKIAWPACLLCGCTIAPHGSRATHEIRTYQGRSDGMIRLEVFTDRSAGGGACLFETVQNAALIHTNSTMQVGGSLTLGNGSIATDPQAIITTVGDVGGKMAAELIKTLVKP